MRVIVATAAIAVPILTLTVWTRSAIPIYRSMWHGPMLLLYLPARMLGLVGFVMMFYQFVLAARLAPIQRAFGRAVIYRRHRTLGKVGFVLILLHGISMLSFDVAVAGEIALDSAKLIGIIARALLTIAVGAALFWKPLKLSNKQWMRIHRLAWLVFPLAFYHAITIGTTINTSRAVLTLFYVFAVVYLLLLIRRFAQAFRSGRSRRAATAE